MANENTSVINTIEYDNEVEYDEDGDVIMEDYNEMVVKITINLRQQLSMNQLIVSC